MFWEWERNSKVILKVSEYFCSNRQGVFSLVHCLGSGPGSVLNGKCTNNNEYETKQNELIKHGSIWGCSWTVRLLKNSNVHPLFVIEFQPIHAIKRMMYIVIDVLGKSLKRDTFTALYVSPFSRSVKLTVICLLYTKKCSPPFYFRLFRPCCQWVNLRLGDIVFLSYIYISFTTTVSGRI